MREALEKGFSEWYAGGMISTMKKDWLICSFGNWLKFFFLEYLVKEPFEKLVQWPFLNFGFFFFGFSN